MVASTVATRKPHSVTVGETGRVLCYKVCVGWAQYSVCCHTIAAAEKRGILRKFLEWLKKTKKTRSTTKMANVNMPKNSGNKKKATQKRKGSANSARNVNMTFPCVCRVLDPKARTKTVEPQSTSTSKTQSSDSMLPDLNMPQQPTFCSPRELPTMPVTQFQQQTNMIVPS